MPNYDFDCETCNTTIILNVKFEDRDQPNNCPDCGAFLRRQFPAPMVTRASYPDGVTNRFKDFKEASKLNKEAAVSKDSTKKEIQKEIRKMGIKIQK
jgi:putative FmdB family regulatory protein